MLNLSIILEESAKRFPKNLAIKFGEHSLTFSELNAASCQVANGLKKIGIEKGDKVALSCPNIPYFPIIYFGILKAGAAVVPLNILLKGREVTYHLNDSDAKAYFCFEGTEELPIGKNGREGFQSADKCEHFIVISGETTTPSQVENATAFRDFVRTEAPEFDSVQTNPEDTCVILYTSGTTGQSKGAELTHFNIFYNAEIASRLFSFRPEDTLLTVLPLFHSFGQVVLMNAGIYSSAANVLLPRFEPGPTLDLMKNEAVTVFAGVPTMYWAMLNHPGTTREDVEKIASTLRLCNSGGAAMPVEVLKAFEKKFNVPILEGYGLSETSPVATFNHPDRPRKPGSIGTPIWGVEVKIVDENDNDLPQGEVGEIVIRGHNIMKGYYKRPDATKEAMRGDWFHSGDVGKMDEDGYFYIVDRTKDMIIRGGFNVYPREIEEVLLTHPAVSLAAVIGFPHERHGEEIKAFVILKENFEITADELVKWSKENMADYKYPRIFEFRDSLPMTATGKILKKELRKK